MLIAAFAYFDTT